MLRLITASFALPSGNTDTKIITYIPEGKNIIYPMTHPDGIEFNVPAERGEEIAANLDRQLQEMKKRVVLPWYDFEHTRKAPVSGYPQRFFYEAGKGIQLEMDWSGSGRAAIDNRDVRYHSPEVYLDQFGVPVELPDRGPLGGLVAEPAFRTNTPVAASDAGQNHDTNHKTPNTMDKLILATCGLLSPAEASLPNADTLAAQRVNALTEQASELTRVKASLSSAEKERDELKEKVTAAETEAKNALKEKADTLVKAAIHDGRLAPRDTDLHDKYRARITAGDGFAEEVLAALPTTHAGLDKSIVNGAENKENKEKQEEPVLTGLSAVAAALAEEAKEKQ